MGPLDHLAYPSDEEIIPDLAQGILGGMGMILSPTTIVREIMSQAMDYDPADEVIKHFSGDWNSVAQMSRAYRNLADYVDECAASLTSEVNTALAEWSGTAATSAEAYALGLLGPALTELATQIRSVGAQCQSVAVGMQQTAALVNTGINWLIDLLVLAVAEAAATALLSWSGVALIAGGVALALTILKITSAARAVGNYLTMAQALIDGTSGVIPGYLGAFKGFESVPIPQP